MNFILQGPFRESVYNLMRKAGYFFEGKEAVREELVFARPPKGYPRFHIYLKVEDENLIFNLHLDQKRPIYKGSPAHSGEYSGDVVAEEAERIKEILSFPPSLTAR